MIDYQKGPRSPGIIQQLQILTKPLETLDKWSEKYGDNFRILGEHSPPTILFSSPDAIQSILTSPYSKICSAPESSSIKFLLGENSLLFLKEALHQQKRRLLMPIFYKDSIKKYGRMISSITQEQLSTLSLETEILIRPFIKQISLHIILQVIFGISSGERYDRLFFLLSKFVKYFDSPLISLMLAFPFARIPIGIWKNFIQVKQELDQLIYTEIAEKRKISLETSDVLSLLIAARDENNHSLQDKEIHDQLMTLVFAGYETTAAALSWGLYWTHYLPEVSRKVEKEVNEVDGEKDPQSLAELPYLSAVCSETLRLYPIALGTFSRTVQQPIEIAGFELEPKTNIHISIYLAHRRQSVYPNPLEFRPERFLERQFSPFEYLPFGGGGRKCLGSHLALYEMKIVLATILRKLRLELVNPRLLKPVRYGLAMIPPKSLTLKITEIRN